MRKCIFLAIAWSLCALDFGAFAATTRADSGQVVNQSLANSSRAATTRNLVKSNAVTTSAPSQKATNNAGPSVVSRAATQKALNTGTKVAAATTNTSVPKECQDNFYGCMDAFCMLDNASGGRCQCSDRITELDQVLEDILKLDDQTYLMATEGVERIQMGEAAEQIISRAKAAGDSVVDSEKSSKKQSRTLDLSMWNNNIFTMDDENVFDDADGTDLVSTFADKKGDSLYTASAKMCASQITDACRSYSSMLQLVYAQKIKSDCTAYENSLRAQKIQSQQKLQAAEKALRDAALEEYQNQNKYATLGECTIAFTECMQTTAECGADYTGCVTLAAQENVRNNKSGSKAKQVKIKGAVSGADIALAASTLDQLLAKKTMCESVTKQCINANKNDAVWESFLHNAAPALKSAELIAEQNLRSNCLPTLAECFKNGCKAQYTENDENYDACLSDPETYKSLCKVQLEPCLEATGGSYDNPEASSLWNSLVAMLEAMKVDACTAEVKSCIMAACGDDYSECIGLDTNTIIDFCPYQKLTACMTEKKDDEIAIRTYVAQIAQALALQIDNAFADNCQKAVNEAMIKYCGSEDECSNVSIEDGIFANLLKVQICQEGTNKCSEDAYVFSEDQIAQGVVTPRLVGRIDLSRIDFSANDKPAFSGPDSSLGLNQKRMRDLSSSSAVAKFYVLSEGQKARGYSDEGLKQVIDSLNKTFNSKLAVIEQDQKIQYCLKGRSFQTITASGSSTSEIQSNTQRFPNLTNSLRQAVGQKLLSDLETLYYVAETNTKEENWASVQKKIDDRIADLVSAEKANQDKVNENSCKQYASDNPSFPVGCGQAAINTHLVVQRFSSYNANTAVCTISKKEYTCSNRVAGCCWQWPSADKVPTVVEKTIQMKKVTREDLL